MKPLSELRKIAEAAEPDDTGRCHHSAFTRATLVALLDIAEWALDQDERPCECELLGDNPCLIADCSVCADDQRCACHELRAKLAASGWQA